MSIDFPHELFGLSKFKSAIPPDEKNRSKKSSPFPGFIFAIGGYYPLQRNYFLLIKSAIVSFCAQHNNLGKGISRPFRSFLKPRMTTTPNLID